MATVPSLCDKPDYTVEGPMKVVYSGFFAAMRRQSAAKTDDEGRKKELEDEVKTWLPHDSEVKLVGTPNWDNLESTLSADFRISASIASNAGKRVLFPANAFHFKQPAMFPHANRVNGVYLYYPFRFDGQSGRQGERNIYLCKRDLEFGGRPAYRQSGDNRRTWCGANRANHSG
jgi:hypothetical protein